MSREQLLADLLKDEDYPSNPFIEPSQIDEAIEDTTALTAASAEAYAVREADEASGRIQASLESIHRTLSTLNAAGGVTQGQYQLAQLAIEANCQQLGIVAPTAIALESFTEEAPTQQISLEELEKIIEAVDANHGALAEDAHESCDKLCEVLKTAIPNAAARVSSVVACAEQGSSDDDAATVSGTDIASFLMNGDEFPANFESYMLNYVAFGKKLAGEFMASVGKAAEKAAVFQNVSFESTAIFQGSTETALGEAVDPRACFTDEDYEVCLPGDGPLFVDNDERGEGIEGIALDLDTLAHEREPTDPSSFAPESEGDMAELPKLTAEQVATIGKALHELAMECDTAQFQEDVYESTRNLDAAIQAYTNAYDSADEGVAEAVSDTASATVEYLGTILTMARWTPIYFLTNLVQTINAFSLYAERSLGKCMVTTENVDSSPLIQVLKGKTVSTENNTTPPADTGTGNGVTDDATVSLEAGFKFRAGMKVRYSKGYGKIIKVFDRPTKYKGEVHHCSREHPKYEVRSDDGKHLSLHKASALTPVG